MSAWVGALGWALGSIAAAVLLWRLERERRHHTATQAALRLSERELGDARAQVADLAGRLQASEDHRHETVGRYEDNRRMLERRLDECRVDVQALTEELDTSVVGNPVALARLRARLRVRPEVPASDSSRPGSGGGGEGVPP